jgi:predicted RecA/RadA family phage recombinase
MLNYVQDGKTLTLTPSADVAAGEGYLFGAGLFGVAIAATASGAAGEFRIEGVVDIAKTSALAISVGDRVFWVPGSKVVDKTATAQVNVGRAILAAANPSATVRILLGSSTAAGA